MGEYQDTEPPIDKSDDDHSYEKPQINLSDAPTSYLLDDKHSGYKLEQPSHHKLDAMDIHSILYEIDANEQKEYEEKTSFNWNDGKLKVTLLRATNIKDSEYKKDVYVKFEVPESAHKQSKNAQCKQRGARWDHEEFIFEIANPKNDKLKVTLLNDENETIGSVEIRILDIANSLQASKRETGYEIDDSNFGLLYMDLTYFEDEIPPKAYVYV